MYRKKQKHRRDEFGQILEQLSKKCRAGTGKATGLTKLNQSTKGPIRSSCLQWSLVPSLFCYNSHFNMSKCDVLMLECLNGSKQAFCVILIDKACGRSQGGMEEKCQRMKFLQAALKLLCCVATSSDVPSQPKLYNK